MHTTFNQAVAATGRLSSSDPNLQNIPIRTALGREIRAAFVAEPGHVLISADYSQIELRVLAHLSGDAALAEAFQAGHRHSRPHGRARVRRPGRPLKLDAHELRRRAKIINYALLYGKTAFTLAKDIGVPQTAAQEFIDAYFAGYPGVRAFIDRTLAEARATGRRPHDDAAAGGSCPSLTSKNGADPRGGRTRDREHAHPGHGRRRPQEGDDRRARGARPLQYERLTAGRPSPAG